MSELEAGHEPAPRSADDSINDDDGHGIVKGVVGNGQTAHNELGEAGAEVADGDESEDEDTESDDSEDEDEDEEDGVKEQGEQHGYVSSAMNGTGAGTANSSSENGLHREEETKVNSNGKGKLDDQKDRDETTKDQGRDGTEEEREGEGGEEDGEDDDDDDLEEEPVLKYSRLQGGTSKIFERDSASALAVSSRFIVLGTHNGAIFVLDFQGDVVKQFRPHSATIHDLSIDTGNEYIASVSVDGKVAIISLLNSQVETFDLRRPLRCVALEPTFGKKNTRQFVSGGMAGVLTLHEKGWLGNREVPLHSGEGPIWAVEWCGKLIAWANDAGVRIYDTSAQQKITFIERNADSPRADLFKCTLLWKDERTLLIGWADLIRVAVVKEGEKSRGQLGVGPATTPLTVEVTAIFQVDCMVSGIAPYGNDFIVLAYLTEDTYSNEATDDRNEQARKAGTRPELMIISKEGEELSSDALTVRNYDRFQCTDYSLAAATAEDLFYVISPRDIVVAKPRDRADHIAWLIEGKKYEDALDEVEKGGTGYGLEVFDVHEIGKLYLKYLMDEGSHKKAAQVSKRVLGIHAAAWEDWFFRFVRAGQIETIIPSIPIKDPQLSRLVYEIILSHFLQNDPQKLLATVKTWPHDIYDIPTIIAAIEDKLPEYNISWGSAPPSDGSTTPLLESLAELFLLNRQPGKALPYFLRLRRSGVFDLIKEHNLFTDVQDQALLLLEFDQAQIKESAQGVVEDPPPHREGLGSQDRFARKSRHGTAIDLLVDHTHSIPVPRVMHQLKGNRRFLFMYLDALFDKDPLLASEYADLQVDLYAEFDPPKLMDFLRASNNYSLETAYKACEARDSVPEMVFLLGRMGDNKKALNLIIQRLGDVHRAIEFANEQNDNDLWEDLLKYSEGKPTFIRGLLEHPDVGIDPLKLIKRIKNGLEIPGLKPALIRILQDYNLRVSLMEGCRSVLYNDCRVFAVHLHTGQKNGFLGTAETRCEGCGKAAFPVGDTTDPLLSVIFLCRHVFHLGCLPGDLPDLPRLTDGLGSTALLDFSARSPSRNPAAEVDRSIGRRIGMTGMLRARMDITCPSCHSTNRMTRR